MPAHRIPNLISRRAGSNGWARGERLLRAVRQGRLTEIPPQTTEYSPTLVCNLGCPECPYRDARHDLGEGRIPCGKFARPDDVRTSTRETASRVLEASRDADVRGVLWTGGGEPTVWPHLDEMLRYSRGLGMTNGLYTNGVQVGLVPAMAGQLVAPECGLAFVRVSISAVSDAAIGRHWGAKPEFVRPQFAGTRNLLEARSRAGLREPAIQVSTIIDGKNVEDLPLVCQAVAEIFGPYRESLGPDDEMVVRPLTIHGRGGYSDHDHDDAVIASVLEVCGRDGRGRRLVESAGLRLYLGFGLNRIEAGEARSYSELIREEYAQRSYSWANGVFLTVGPDGSVYPSTEYNCKPGWSLGNLRTQSVAEIYRGRRRREVLDLFHSVGWGPQLCQATARTARLDRIIKGILAGEIGDEDIEQVRQAALQSHALLLD